MDPFLDDEQQQASGFDIGELLRAFWRRKLLFFIPFILCLAMAVVAIRTMTPIYASSGQILIKLSDSRSKYLEDPQNQFGGPRGNVDAYAFHEMNMLLTSSEFLDSIVLELDLHRALQASRPEGAPPLDDDAAVQRARNRLKSMIKLKSDGARLFRLEVRDPDPDVAYDFAGVILEKFVAGYRASQMESSTQVRDFLQRQLEVYRDELTGAESALSDYQSGLASAALASNPINAVNLSTAEANLLQLRTRFNGADAEELEQLSRSARAALGSLPNLAAYRRDPSVSSLLTELQTSSLQIELLETGNRGLRDLETQLGQLRVRLRSLIDSMVAQQLPNLGLMDRNRISQFVYFSLYRGATDQVITQLDGHIRDFRQFTARQPAQSTRMAELQSDVTRARNLVEGIEAEITQHNMNLAASMSEVRIQVRIRETTS
jgi:uncharacterized protein involved in exopolysaccharide biosynthesis